MSKLTDRFNAVHVFNEYGLLELVKDPDFDRPAVALAYNGEDPISRTGSHWVVIRPGYETNPESRYGMRDRNKTFSLFGYNGKHTDRKALALEQAKEWCADRYKIDADEWVKSPFRGALVPKYVLDAAMDKLQAAEAESK